MLGNPLLVTFSNIAIAKPACVLATKAGSEQSDATNF